MTDNTLKALFDNRDRVHHINTRSILSSIKPTLEAIIEFMDIKEESHTDLLTWEAVSLVDGDKHPEPVVYIVGTVSYKLGETVQHTDGSIITIDETNQKKINKIIRVGIPYSLAADGTTSEIVDFLYMIAEQQEGDVEEFDISESEAFKDAESLLNQIEQDTYKKDNDYIDYRYNEYKDFELDDLTEKQKEHFDLFLKSQGLK